MLLLSLLCCWIGACAFADSSVDACLLFDLIAVVVLCLLWLWFGFGLWCAFGFVNSVLVFVGWAWLWCYVCWAGYVLV